MELAIEMGISLFTGSTGRTSFCMPWNQDHCSWCWSWCVLILMTCVVRCHFLGIRVFRNSEVLWFVVVAPFRQDDEMLSDAKD
jgi:hypothetical protein